MKIINKTQSGTMGNMITDGVMGSCHNEIMKIKKEKSAEAKLRLVEEVCP
jgi:hypothetical protein